jgi:hypothetical protein
MATDGNSKEVVHPSRVTNLVLSTYFRLTLEKPVLISARFIGRHSRRQVLSKQQIENAKWFEQSIKLMNNPYNFNSIPTSIAPMARRCSVIRPAASIWGYVGTGKALFALNLDHTAKDQKSKYRKRSGKIT